MTNNIEIEYKQLLTKQEYEIIEHDLVIKDSQIIEQENFYFETPLFSLKKQGQAIRIRVLNNEFELCRKTQRENDILEENIFIDKQIFLAICQQPNLINDYFDNVATDLRLLGSMKTKRIEYHYQNGLICLDKSVYLGQTDYEIEYEAADYSSEGSFKDFLNNYGIEYQRSLKSKIARFSETLEKRGIIW
ncbi:CYTH domain-containing protein [Erysipelotrichaceae bacterium OttesenSCG-928-M19]|nr:CYTH domain-containing protein [Erysipelotrichaceae bacterium OttesenSCG-928-M19]